MLWFWIGFILFILFCLALDLGLLQRKAHEVSVKEALTWSAVWIAMALLFTVFIYFGYENHWLGLGKAPEGRRLSRQGFNLGGQSERRTFRLGGRAEICDRLHHRALALGR